MAGEGKGNVKRKLVRRTDVKSKTNDYISKVQDGEWERIIECAKESGKFKGREIKFKCD